MWLSLIHISLQVLGQWNDWYVVEYNGVTGYASRRYIEA